MQEYFENIIETLQENIRELSMEIDNPIVFSEMAIKLSLDTLAELKKYVLEHPFQNIEDEIVFFKNIKPRLTSKLIYYNSIYRIETKKPSGSQKALKKYYIKELGKLKSYFDTNLDFYKYYRTGSTFLDYKYFVRGKFDIKLSLDNYFFETDKRFSTSHDFKVAKILASDLLKLYLENRLLEIQQERNHNISQHNPNAKLHWTGSKVALTELLYALQTEGVFNNGTADLKDIAECFEEIFSINLGQYRRTFLEIRVRKDDRAKFLTNLREKLLKRMDDTDESIY
ncbi:tetracycline regulation of excision, RteC [Riemerella anatipestifer]|uniref:RteC domain-containing protein n=1 Tax=Riemerella anatipestifer TaxID=34085 RepID=UPI001372A163|nr:RteC domain-containing protein [Riemerella anatipestifer]MBT0556811.1 RteC domain-containing protein [Riemerella anatipestifer]NAV17222.1 tetracycline regulation of excision, RteC [Riemerella anatipestifer]UZX27774.1 RteC domain-containing protein [Riemerella anatipestifer]